MTPIQSMMATLTMQVKSEDTSFAKDFLLEIQIVRGASCTASGECSRISTNSSLWMPLKITMVCNVTLKQLLFFYVPGVEFALYFSWLGFLNYALIPPTIAGIFVFFYGTDLIGTDVPQLVGVVLENFLSSSKSAPLNSLLFCKLHIFILGYLRHP